MNNKKSLFFGLIEMNATMFNVLYTLLCLVVLASTGILLLISLMLINDSIFCNEYTGRFIILWLSIWCFLIWKVFD
jgi:hypothetical protein